MYKKINVFVMSSCWLIFCFTLTSVIIIKNLITRGPIECHSVYYITQYHIHFMWAYILNNIHVSMIVDMIFFWFLCHFLEDLLVFLYLVFILLSEGRSLWKFFCHQPLAIRILFFWSGHTMAPLLSSFSVCSFSCMLAF